MSALTLAAALVSILAAPASAADPGEPRAKVLDASYDFGTVVQGTKLEHTFIVQNNSATPLRIARVTLTPPLVVRRMPAAVAPGQQAAIDVELATTAVRGQFEGEIAVSTDDAGQSALAMAFTGRVLAPVDVLPARALFVTGTRTAPGTASVEIVNQESGPIRIDGVEHSRGIFTTRLESVEEGRRWRLAVTLVPDGPAGRHAERISVRTSSRSSPMLTILAHTYLRERVYTFPDSVDLGSIPLSVLKRDASSAERVAQTLMVYQIGGTDFRASLAADLPFLRLHSERGPRGDRYQTTITMAPDALAAGPIRGTIVIETNDPAFPRISVPVSGTILDG